MPPTHRPVTAPISHRGGVDSRCRSLLALGTPCCKSWAGCTAKAIPSWLWLARCWLPGDVKPFRSGPVRRLSPSAGPGHLANVGWEAPWWFSGYSQSK